jgi:DNA-binding CsgD family transcriptional regulator
MPFVDAPTQPSDLLCSSSVRAVLERYFQRFALSKRETEATFFLAQGLRAKEIALHMSCSEKTVYAHLARVCKKIGCRDNHEIVCALLAFACDALNGPAEHPSFVEHAPAETHWARLPRQAP